MRAAAIRGHGITTTLPPRWEGRIYRRPMPAGEVSGGGTGDVRDAATGSVADAPHPAATGWPGERTHPVVHLANFPLGAGVGDFGTGAVERMGPRNIFVALLEYGPECLGTALYAPQGMPRPRADDFRPNMLQQRLAGQAGFQTFFTAAGRPLCLYVVLGSHAERRRLAPQVTEVLDGIEVAPR